MVNNRILSVIVLLVLLVSMAGSARGYSQAGGESRAIMLPSKSFPAVHSEGLFPEIVIPDPTVQGMINQVTQEQVYQYDRELAGELPVWVDGGWYTITTRNTDSGTPIQKSTHYVGQLMEGMGLNVEYHVWKNDTNPNVIGQIPGLVNPDNIFIVGAHIDDTSGAPGADDNASGSVATLLAADILSQYLWSCTLRFAFWTGEEQGLFGSAAYAQRAYKNGENIVGYLNMDMIAWNTPNSPAVMDVVYNPNMPPTLELAQLYADVVDAYNLNLLPQLISSFDLGGRSDHESFWDHGYTAIYSLEDSEGDLNPYYHTPQDTPAHTDPAYFTNFVKASIATYAHMSGCLIPSHMGYLDGHINASGNQLPIRGATVTVRDRQGSTFTTTTDASGHYSRTLLADAYTVTASLAGYITQSQTANITAGQLTTLDFALPEVTCRIFLSLINK